MLPLQGGSLVVVEKHAQQRLGLPRGTEKDDFFFDLST